MITRAMRLSHGYTLSVIYNVAVYVSTCLLAGHAWEEFFVWSLLLGNSHHCSSTDAIELVIVASLQVFPLWSIYGIHDFIPEVCHQILVSQMNQKGLIIHHCPVAICSFVSYNRTLILVFQFKFEFIHVVIELEVVTCLNNLKFVWHFVSANRFRIEKEVRFSTGLRDFEGPIPHDEILITVHRLISSGHSSES